MTRRRFCMAAIVSLLVAGPAVGEPHAVLGLDVTDRARRGRPVDVPVLFTYFDTTITALVFSLDIDVERLVFNPADRDQDGVPDSVTLPSGTPSLTWVGFDRSDSASELDFMLINLSGAPLPRGVLLNIRLRALRGGDLAKRIKFSIDPPPSFGDAQGQSVEGTTVVITKDIFSDGFETGDASRWSEIEGLPSANRKELP